MNDSAEKCVTHASQFDKYLSVTMARNPGADTPGSPFFFNL